MKWWPIVLALAALLTLASPANARFRVRGGSAIASFSASLYTGKLSQGLTAMRGAGFQVSLERFMNPDVSIGVIAAYFGAEQDLSTAINSRMASYSATPIVVGPRWYFDFIASGGFLGVAAGAQFHTLETTVNGEVQAQRVADLALSFPVGLVVPMPASSALVFSYVPFWTPDNTLVDNLHHTFNAGLGFRFGD